MIWNFESFWKMDFICLLFHCRLQMGARACKCALAVVSWGDGRARSVNPEQPRFHWSTVTNLLFAGSLDLEMIKAAGLSTASQFAISSTGEWGGVVVRCDHSLVMQAVSEKLFTSWRKDALLFLQTLGAKEERIFSCVVLEYIAKSRRSVCVCACACMCMRVHVCMLAKIPTLNWQWTQGSWIPLTVNSSCDFPQAPPSS